MADSESTPSASFSKTFLIGGKKLAVLAGCCFALGPGTPVHADSPSMSSYMNCARAIGVAQGDTFAVISGDRPTGKGIYIFTDRNAYFLHLGPPQTENLETREFLFRFRSADPELREMYLSFRERKPGSQSRFSESIAYQMTPPAEFWLGLYRTVELIVALDDRAREMLSQRLRERVATIKSFIDDKNSFSTPGEAGVAYASDRVAYIKKLESCRLVGDRRLQSVVSEEIEKLETGFPGATIWEIQVDGKSAPGKTKRLPGMPVNYEPAPAD